MTRLLSAFWRLRWQLSDELFLLSVAIQPKPPLEPDKVRQDARSRL